MFVSPDGWAKDKLTAFMDMARHNQFATFANKRGAISDLLAIDELLFKLLNEAVNLRPWYPADFLLRAHSAYRAGCTLVMAGQIVESQAVFRQSIESAGYGFFIGGDSARMERWLRRSDTDESRRTVRREFTHGAIRDSIAAVAPRVSDLYGASYDAFIDFGAHPNELGNLGSLAIKELNRGDKRFETTYLHGDGAILEGGIAAARQCGIVGLCIARLIYPARCELLGISAEIDKLTGHYRAS